MLASGFKQLSLAEKFDCTETTINQLLADSYQNPQMGPSSCTETSSGLPWIPHYGELCNYFIIDHNVIIIEIKCTINVMCLYHPETTAHPTVYGKTVLHKTGPWCQKGWGPLYQGTGEGKSGGETARQTQVIDETYRKPEIPKFLFCSLNSTN